MTDSTVESLITVPIRVVEKVATESVAQQPSREASTRSSISDTIGAELAMATIGLISLVAGGIGAYLLFAAEHYFWGCIPGFYAICGLLGILLFGTEARQEWATHCEGNQSSNGIQEGDQK